MFAIVTARLVAKRAQRVTYSTACCGRYQAINPGNGCAIRILSRARSVAISAGQVVEGRSLPLWRRRPWLFGLVVVPYGLLGLIPTGFSLMAAYHRVINSPPQVSRGYMFFATTGFLSLPLSMLMFLSAPVVLLTDRNDRRFFNYIQHVWAKYTCYPFLEATVIGVDKLEASKHKAVVYVSNHQSWLDIYLLLSQGFPIKFISKQEIFYIPLVGWVMGLIGHIPLKRGDKKSGKTALETCVTYLLNGVSVFFFPEGTRGKEREKLNDFKIGAFKVAVNSEAAVLPIIIRGSDFMMPREHSFWLEEDAHELQMTVLDEVDSKGLEPDALRDKVYTEMSRNLKSSVV